MQRVTADDLDAALDGVDDDGVELEVPTLAAIGDKVLVELNRRLDSHERGDLSSTMLLRFANDYLKYQALAEAKREALAADPVVFRVADIIAQAGLPVGRRRQMLLERRAALADEIAEIDGGLEVLDGDGT